MNKWARTTRRLTFATWVLAGISAIELGSGQPDDPTGDWKATLAGLVQAGPAPLQAGDEDGDGLSDAFEQEIAHRFAPVVILDREDWNRPASVPWLLARVDFEGIANGDRRLASMRQLPAATYAGVTPALSARSESEPFSISVRRGSDDPAEWTTYVHVYPRADGDINLQYWFFYPYNDGPGFFDHESDWEHVTVRVNREGSPLGVYLAHHKEDNPGTYRAWSRVRRDGDHPVVFSARGTHASYAGADDLPWFERISACEDLARCTAPVWRTWEGGSLADLGERARPRLLASVMDYAGPWGATGFLPGSSAPVGPTHAAGFCHAGFQRCKEPSRRDR